MEVIVFALKLVFIVKWLAILARFMRATMSRSYC
jgi:hypothetical protein